MKFAEEKLEQVFIELLQQEDFTHCLGSTIVRTEDEVLLEDDLWSFLRTQYKDENITDNEIQSIIIQLRSLPSSDLYESNKAVMRMLSNGFLLKKRRS